MLDSPDPPNCPAPTDADGAPPDDRDALRAELDRCLAAIGERDRTIAELAARLEEARLTQLWQRTEIAARDQRIADLWEQADGLNRALAALEAGPGARPQALGGAPASPSPTRPGRALLGLLTRWRGAPDAPGTTADERPRRVA